MPSFSHLFIVELQQCILFAYYFFQYLNSSQKSLHIHYPHPKKTEALLCGKTIALFPTSSVSSAHFSLPQDTTRCCCYEAATLQNSIMCQVCQLVLLAGSIRKIAITNFVGSVLACSSISASPSYSGDIWE